jgi:hypothetical protein
MTATFEEANIAMRAAVKARLDATPKDDPKMVGYVSPAVTEPLPEVAKAEEMQHVTFGYDAETLKAAKDYMDAYNLRNQVERERLRGDGLLGSKPHPTSQAFYDLCDKLKATHAGKSKDYGCPSGTDPLANIRNGAKFVGIPAWRAAMVRLSDKVTRLATFNATGTLHYEGVEDTLVDLASYALLSLLLYREENTDGNR